MRLYDWWDILVWISLGPFPRGIALHGFLKWCIHSSSPKDILSRIMRQVITDTSGLDPVAQRYLRMHLESLRYSAFMYFKPMFIIQILTYFL